ncbi:hydrogenase maturation protease [Paenibacillus illinoisensis]|uniref:Hydrogenase maturation protease n=1 Tax=Paenibacillus illinoisensis TaxID=59845 RepID=A0A2W0CQI4_9BACL|nr:hydrogenase maturation protease [Paenibacillus illinoisensis]PYY25941.1 Hydrogenase maturation protease [Paenibacillus illinoisensis]
MSRLTVLGIGSQLMGNDGIGVYVVEALSVTNTDERITYIAGETDIDFCLQYIEDADVLLIVDAVISGNPIGTTTICKLNSLVPEERGISAHNLHILHMIPLIYPNLTAYMLGIEVKAVEHGIGLDKTVSSYFEDILKQVLVSIGSLLNN